MGRQTKSSLDKRKGSQNRRVSLSGIQRQLDTFQYNIAAFEFYPPLERLRLFVEAHPDKPIKWEQAAKIAHYAPRHFSTYFHNKVGVSFREWEGHRRIRLALKVFSKRDDSIIQIAWTCGFTLSTFQRQCRRWVGTSPKAIRNLFRQLANLGGGALKKDCRKVPES